MNREFFRLEVYVPETHLEQLKAALFAAGAGELGKYDCCAFQSRGRGQFRPLPGARPFLGNIGQIEQVEEWKIELVLPKERLAAAIAALKTAHPYETPAYQYWAVQH